MVIIGAFKNKGDQNNGITITYGKHCSLLCGVLETNTHRESSRGFEEGEKMGKQIDYKELKEYLEQGSVDSWKKSEHLFRTRIDLEGLLEARLLNERSLIFNEVLEFVEKKISKKAKNGKTNKV